MTPEEIVGSEHLHIYACDCGIGRVAPPCELLRDRTKRLIATALAASEQRECSNCNWLTLQKQELEIKLQAREQRVRELEERDSGIDGTTVMRQAKVVNEQKARLQASERALERVRPYAAHKRGCAWHSAEQKPDGSVWGRGDCTCGLDAALASPESPQ